MGRTSNLALGALVGCVLAATAVRAGDERFAPWLGVYQNASVSESEAIIVRAIEKGTSLMGPLRRMVARKRLKAVNLATETVHIVVRGEQLVVTFDGKSYAAPTAGGPQKRVDPQGKPVLVSYRADGRTLRARFLGDDGEKRIDFERGADARELAMHVTVLSDQLPAPIRYSLRYLRKP